MTGNLGLPNLRQAWINLGTLQKLVWMAGLLLVVLAAGLLWATLMQREYRVLFSGLPDKEGGQVVAALEKLRIPHQLNEVSGAIEVPADQLHTARYRLAAQGLPAGEHSVVESPTMRFGLSSFQEQAAQQRVLEAELARSIEEIEGVESARVHLALPKQSSFLRESAAPSASVLLKLAPRAALSAGQVEAIRLLVASSVPGMAAAQVSVLDQQGTVLGQTSPAGEPSPPLTQAEATSETEVTHSAAGRAPPMISVEPSSGSDAKPASNTSWPDRLDTEPYQTALLGLLALLTAWLGLRLRARRRQSGLVPEAGEMESQDLDARLVQLRQQVMTDPRLTASVIKQWMQET